MATKARNMTLVEIEQQIGADILTHARAVPHPLAWCAARARDAASSDSRIAYRSLVRILRACGVES